MNRRNVLVFFVVTLSFAFAAASILNIEEDFQQDRDIYIREHENTSCGWFEYFFEPKYVINDTTTCVCAWKELTRCITTIVHNTTTTTTPAPADSVRDEMASMVRIRMNAKEHVAVEDEPVQTSYDSDEE